MSYAPYLIANYQTGLDTDQEPWLDPADAFTEIENGFIRHGVIRKRDGIQTFGTLGNDKVTGIYNFVTNTGDKEIIATDISRTYRFNTITKVFDAIDPPGTWTSSNYQWFANFGVTGSTTQNTLYMTNFADNIRTYVTGGTPSVAFLPQYGALATDIVTRCLLIFVLKNRLVLLNTFENSLSPSQKPQRARWSQAQDPTVWDQNTPGRGGFVDAPTGDFIIGARFLQEYIIVFFSNSTWSLKPTSDPALPFRWDKINNFRACDATFGTISHDRYVVSFGKTGIVGCDGVEVKRIDEKIQDFVFDTIDAENFGNLYSDRNYKARRSWTLYPAPDSTTNDHALIRNEEDGSWSTYDIALSCLGQGESYQDFTFADFVGAFDFSFLDFTDETFQSFYLQGTSNLLLGGDYEGNVYILEVGGDDAGDDISFSLTGAGWNPFKEKGIEAQLGWVDIYCDVDPQTQLTVSFFLSDEVAPYAQQLVNLVPEQGFVANIQNVALTNPCEITADSHGLRTGNIIYLSGIDGTIEANGGSYTVTVIDENTFSLDGIDATAFNAYTSGGIVTEYNPDEFDKCWKRVYAGGIGYLHQVKVETSGSDQTLYIHSITPWFRPVGSRMLT